MNLDKLEKIIELVRRHGVHQVEIEDGDLKISVTATPPHAPAPGVYAGAPMAAMMPGGYPLPPPPMAAMTTQTAPAPAHEAAPAPKKAQAAGKAVKSPFVGTFYRSATPGGDPFVEVGKRVKKGDTLCIIEAMKLMNEIEAEFDGVIKEILAENEQPVEFDQALFVIE